LGLPTPLRAILPEDRFLIPDIFTYLFTYLWFGYPYHRSRPLVRRLPPNFLRILMAYLEVKLPILTGIRKPEVPEKNFGNENTLPFLHQSQFFYYKFKSAQTARAYQPHYLLPCLKTKFWYLSFLLTYLLTFLIWPIPHISVIIAPIGTNFYGHTLGRLLR
jgi:hypothetical protein